jgi:hypothetical protein
MHLPPAVSSCRAYPEEHDVQLLRLVEESTLVHSAQFSVAAVAQSTQEALSALSALPSLHSEHVSLAPAAQDLQFVGHLTQALALSKAYPDLHVLQVIVPLWSSQVKQLLGHFEQTSLFSSYPSLHVSQYRTSSARFVSMLHLKHWYGQA